MTGLALPTHHSFHGGRGGKRGQEGARSPLPQWPHAWVPTVRSPPALSARAGGGSVPLIAPRAP